jgi:hypothetical protein
MTTTPSLTEQQALAAALASVNAGAYAWEVADIEQEIKEENVALWQW